MPNPRPFSLIRTNDQWLRASFAKTALLDEVVQLAWVPDEVSPQKGQIPFSRLGAGLAFDTHCRLYHSVPDSGQVERWLWSLMDPLADEDETSAPLDLFERSGNIVGGDFMPPSPASGALNQPRALATDAEDRLFIAEYGARCLLVFDLAEKRLLRRIGLSGLPLDLAGFSNAVYALQDAPPGLLQLGAHTGPEALDWLWGITQPTRVAVDANGQLFVLSAGGTQSAAVWNCRANGKTKLADVPFATDIDFQTAALRPNEQCPDQSQVLVAALRPGEEFRRFCVSAGNQSTAELPPLKARGYDGLGIVRTPDGRIGFWGTQGFRHAVAARLIYQTNGQVLTFRLDSGAYHSIWGRLFMDACVPAQTRLTIRCVATDEPPEDPAPTRALPANVDPTTVSKTVDQTLSPPLPPQSLVTQLQEVLPRLLHRRESGCEQPWIRPVEGDPFETYEAPIIAEPGRYLWVLVELTGTTRTSPRFRRLRAERFTHDYLRRLPKTFSREPDVAAFLGRYLAMFEGLSGEWEGKAQWRAILLNPQSTPAELLPWLAGFLGLTLDERMEHAPRPDGSVVDVRRQLVAEAAWLFRFRGTVPGLTRFLQIYLGVGPVLVEKFRLRGLGDPNLGSLTGVASNSVLGAGFRVGGAVGDDQAEFLTGTSADAFATFAHRFSVVIPATLSDEQGAVVHRILDLHRPAHTLVEVCTVGAGMRVGRGLMVEINSIIGRSGAFRSFQVAGSFLGRGTVAGNPRAGTQPGGSRAGQDSRVG